MTVMTTVPVVVTIKEPHCGDNSTYGIMVHAITKGVIVAPRRKATNIQQHSITTSTGTIEIVTIVIENKIPEDVGRIVK